MNMSINLFAISMEWRYMEILSIKIAGCKERALFCIGDGYLEFFFIKIY
jgi:hypothetical protein